MSCQWKNIQNWKRNWLVVSKLTWGLWYILTRALENLKYLHFNGLPLTKVYNVCAKKVQWSYIWWHWISMQSLKENWFLLSKMVGRIWGIFTKAFKSIEIGTSMGFFYPKLENSWTWNLQGSCLWWQLKKIQNWKRNSTIVSKLTWGLWWVLGRALENLKNLHFNGLSLAKVCNVWVRKVQRSYVWWH